MEMCSLCSLWYIWILSAYLILFLSVCEAFYLPMCLQQQYDFLVISAVYIIVDGMIIVLCVSTLFFYSLEYSHFPL